MSEPVNSSAVMVHSMLEVERFGAWILAMVVGVAVFFQVYLSLPGGLINLNLADPFAILALAAVSVHLLFSGQLPAWRIRQFNFALGAVSLLLLVGFMHGWQEIGVTQWALGGRLFGWLVLLGYLSVGYLLVANAGAHGLRRFAETLIATAVIVVLLQAVLRFFEHFGVSTGARIPLNFEGYTRNRNAFAFQLLTCMGLLLGYSQVYARRNIGVQRQARPWIFSLLLGIVLIGLVWTGSRAGIFVGVVLLAFSWFSRLADRRVLSGGVIFCFLFWSGIWLLGQFDFKKSSAHVQPLLSSESSTADHWETVIRGLEMWWQSPVWGAGLGVFTAKSSVSNVIHSTPVWILAELGLIGCSVFGWMFFLLARHAIRFSRAQSARRALLLLLLAFVLFSLVHEIFYQRIFWLVLGALLAQPFAARLNP